MILPIDTNAHKKTLYPTTVNLGKTFHVNILGNIVILLNNHVQGFKKTNNNNENESLLIMARTPLLTMLVHKFPIDNHFQTKGWIEFFQSAKSRRKNASRGQKANNNQIQYPRGKKELGKMSKKPNNEKLFT